MKKIVFYCLFFISGFVFFSTCNIDDPEKFTVTFNLDYPGTPELAAIQVEKDASGGSLFPADPRRDGYTFKGWYDGTEKITGNTLVTKNMNLKADWAEQTLRDQILQEIEDNWESLGYAEKPEKYMALTFDDGPSTSREGTAGLLAELEKHKVRATFFIWGARAASNQALIRAIRDAGHEFGNHSYTHQSMGDSAPANIREEIEKTQDIIAAASVTNTNREPAVPKYFRAPNLNTGANLFAVCAEMNLPLIHGYVSNDYSGIPATQIVSNILANALNWQIVLNHDPSSAQNGFAAVADTVKGLREKGYYLVTVSELLALRGGNLTPGKVYNNFITVP